MLHDLTGIQCRLARVALGWGLRELAKAADVSQQTIVRLEKAKSFGRQRSNASRTFWKKTGSSSFPRTKTVGSVSDFEIRHSTDSLGGLCHGLRHRKSLTHSQMQACPGGRRLQARCRNAGQLGFGPDAECFDLWLAVLLTRGKADIGRLVRNVAFDVVKHTDTIESLSSNLGFV